MDWHWKILLIVSANQLPGLSLPSTFTSSGLKEKLPNLQMSQLFTAYLFRLIFASLFLVNSIYLKYNKTFQRKH